jgi:hypothetical protein
LLDKSANILGWLSFSKVSRKKGLYDSETGMKLLGPAMFKENMKDIEKGMNAGEMGMLKF